MRVWIVRNNALDELHIHAEILVHQDVSKPSNLLPGNLRFQSLIFRADPPGRFRQNLEIADHRVLNHVAAHETGPGCGIGHPADIVFNSLNTLQDVIDVKQITLRGVAQKGTASRNTASRSLG